MGSKPLPAEIISHGPDVRFLTSGVPPPSVIYVGPDDKLFVVVLNSAANAQIEVSYQVIRADGSLTLFDQTFVVTSDRISNGFFIPLPEGYLLHVNLRAASALVRRGQFYTKAQLRRGGPVTTHLVAELCAGCPDNQHDVSWPTMNPQGSIEGPGMLRAIVGTDPAAGAEISETVPTGARWRLRGVVATLVTDATVANRQPSLVLDDGANVYARMPFDSAQVGTQTIAYSWACGGNPANGSTVARGMPLNDQAYLFQAHRFRTATAGLVAGDNWSAPVYLVEEWIEQ
jgi:hypothetical protein